jgi:hypothetical protein
VVPISLLLIALMSLLRISIQLSGVDNDAKDARGPI